MENILILCVIPICVLLFAIQIELKKAREREQKQFTAQLIIHWMSQTSMDRWKMVKRIPNPYDINNYSSAISMERIRQIFLCEDELSDDIMLRHSIVEMLNFFEYISVLYLNGIADKKIIDRSMKNPMIRWHEALEEFIKLSIKYNRYNPWEPFSRLIENWKSEKGDITGNSQITKLVFI